MLFDIRNKNITSLLNITFPKGITHLDCSFNQLTNLEGCPSEITHLFCTRNKITSLRGCPSGITHLQCCHNQLINLDGCPDSVIELQVGWNNITSLIGLPHRVQDLFCANNKLTSLRGPPGWWSSDIGRIICFQNQLVSLEGFPNKAQCIHHADANGFANTKLHLEHNEILAKKIIEHLWKNRCVKLIQKCWNRYWLVPNAQNGGVSRYIKKVCDDLNIMH